LLLLLLIIASSKMGWGGSPDSNVIHISSLISHIRKQEKEEMQP
jgi:hypothetical protein